MIMVEGGERGYDSSSSYCTVLLCTTTGWQSITSGWKTRLLGRLQD